MPSLNGVRVMVVDDEQDARTLLRRLLEGLQAEVVTAGSAAEAIGLFTNQRPHVLVTDIGMPEEDGYELLRKVRAMEDGQPTTPAIALTAFARSEDRKRALMSGFQMHVAKPVDPVELTLVIASLAGQSGAKR